MPTPAWRQMPCMRRNSERGMQRAEQDFPIAVGLDLPAAEDQDGPGEPVLVGLCHRKEGPIFLAVDLADNELAFGPEVFAPLCSNRAKSEGFAVTIHAGEAEGPQAAIEHPEIH